MELAYRVTVVVYVSQGHQRFLLAVSKRSQIVELGDAADYLSCASVGCKQAVSKVYGTQCAAHALALYKKFQFARTDVGGGMVL